MIHLRTDWQAIQDVPSPFSETRRSILQDEPVFLIRAKDPLWSKMVKTYAELARHYGSDSEYCDRLNRWADEGSDYAKAKREDGTWGPEHAPDAPELLS